MDKERPNIPLPDGSTGRAPAETKNTGVSRERLLMVAAGVLAVAIATWFVIFALRAGRTAAQVVNDSAGELFTVQEEIVQVSVPGEGERYVLFYKSDEALACALLSRSASGYKLIDASGHISFTPSGKQGVWMASALKSDTKEYLVFGILFDDAVNSVKVDGMAATMVDTAGGNYRCWFYIGEGNTSINSESVVYT